MNITTRKFPRTLAEAFPRGTEYASAIERSRRTDHSGIVIVVISIVLAIAGMLIGAMLA